ncbi:hypothetical protein TWF481_009085 [Arthrobotrys musiformis]|uniref:Uncharacterized protein n=1 Tax=Arthrobotrys musiformis TaxID=47236 RepID=A0AAV9W4L5_9PEZI
MPPRFKQSIREFLAERAREKARGGRDGTNESNSPKPKRQAPRPTTREERIRARERAIAVRIDNQIKKAEGLTNGDEIEELDLRDICVLCNDTVTEKSFMTEAKEGLYFCVDCGYASTSKSRS